MHLLTLLISLFLVQPLAEYWLHRLVHVLCLQYHVDHHRNWSYGGDWAVCGVIAYSARMRPPGRAPRALAVGHIVKTGIYSPGRIDVTQDAKSPGKQNRTKGCGGSRGDPNREHVGEVGVREMEIQRDRTGLCSR